MSVEYYRLQCGQTGRWLAWRTIEGDMGYDIEWVSSASEATIITIEWYNKYVNSLKTFKTFSPGITDSAHDYLCRYADSLRLVPLENDGKFSLFSENFS